MGKINVLDKQVAELIAAGEVVERPASIVKELVENAIDAGASVITVEIKNGGIPFIRITDNGKGIEPEDVPLAFLRHATSKVRNAEDLDAIFTLGFRGEALASICAMARVEMMTRTADNDTGIRIVIEGGEILNQSEAGCPIGTTIVVRDVFFNTPARMKFLKKNVSEANAIAGVIERIALSHPEISIKFIRDTKEELHTPGDNKLLSCIYSVYGKDFADTLIPVDLQRGGIGVKGYISSPVHARANRSMQHFYINARYVRSRTCMVALEEAYKTSVMVGKFPACVLNISLSPNTVDVNVHPAKIEVRFADERPIYDEVYFAVKSALSKESATASIELNKKTRLPFTGLLNPKDGNSSVKQYTFTDVEKPYNRQTSIEKQHSTVNFPKTMTNHDVEHKARELIFQDDSARMLGVKPLMNAYNNMEQPSYKNPIELLVTKQPISSETDRVENHPLSSVKVKSITDHSSKEEESPVKKQDFPYENDRFAGAKLVGEIFETYILVACDDALFLVDKHAAHERLIYEQLKNRKSPVEKQMLLTPATVTLSRGEYTALIEQSAMLDELGFEVEDFGDGTILVRTTPMFISTADIVLLVNEIAGNMVAGKREIVPRMLDEIYHRMACRAAIKAHDKSGALELSYIIECLRENSDVKFCPHGRPIVAKIDKREIEKRFGRE